MMNDRVLIDTSAFYAIVSDADIFHQRAVHTYTWLIDRRAELYTTSYILLEATALIHRRLGFQTLTNFMDVVRDDVNVLWVDRRAHWRGWELLRERTGRALSFVDCVTIVVAQSLNTKLFAFDEDFSREGLPVLPTPDP